ncbi:MAG TPA: iron chelate uptake ABC transporter family permease subunit [Phycisphaerales bacterium]|nr:iron chelate uptake ABC transporter family permease subunit [Phycisphaerales bacterium]
MSEGLWDILLLKDASTRTVVSGTALLGLAAGIIGAFAVLRRRSLVGDAIAHASLPGICVAYFVVGDRNFAALLLGALVFGLLGSACIAAIRDYTRIKEDAAIGIVLGSFFGLGIVLSTIIQRQPSGNRAGLDGFLFGKAASMITSDVLTIASVAGFILAIILVFFKEFRLLCFDRQFAAVQGRPVAVMDLLLLALIALCTVAGLPAVGVVLMAALLIIPAAAARFWTENLTLMVALSGGVGVVSAVAGTLASATIAGPANSLSRGLPTGPCIIITASIIFLVSMLLAPQRGMIPDLFRRFSLKRELALQSTLRHALQGAPAPDHRPSLPIDHGIHEAPDQSAPRRETDA